MNTEKMNKTKLKDVYAKVVWNVSGVVEPDAPRVYVGDDEDRKYVIRLIDDDTKEVVDQTMIKSNEWFKGSIWWYVNWLVVVMTIDGEEIYRENFDLKGKLIRIIINSDSIGDTIAWFPYVEEFRKKHQCKVICQNSFSWFWEEDYPEIIFVPRETDVRNTYCTYVLGTTFDEDYKYRFPSSFINTPMQKCATDILGLPDKEIRPMIYKSLKERMIQDKYVCISQHSQGRDKGWNDPGGWQHLVDHLKAAGLQVMAISKEKCNLDGIIDMCGDHPLEDRINQLEHCEFYVGISSGISWLAWAVGKHTILISDVTPPWSEFQSNITRIHNKRNNINKVSYAAPEFPSPKEYVINKVQQYVSSHVKFDEEKIENKFTELVKPDDFKLLIMMATYNRKGTTEVCLGDFYEQKHHKDKILIYDDHSDDYDLEWVSQFADQVIKLPKKAGIIQMRIQHLIHFVKQNEYDVVYFTDNDAIHDPDWRDKLKELYYLDIDGKHRRPVCLYNSAFHGNSTRSIYYKHRVFLRRTAPGISMLLDREMAIMILNKLNNVQSQLLDKMWDYLFIDMLGRLVITSDISYVDHFGFTGLHNRNPERDKAISPTVYLKRNRPKTLRKIVEKERNYLTKKR